MTLRRKLCKSLFINESNTSVFKYIPCLYLRLLRHLEVLFEENPMCNNYFFIWQGLLLQHTFINIVLKALMKMIILSAQIPLNTLLDTTPSSVTELQHKMKRLILLHYPLYYTSILLEKEVLQVINSQDDVVCSF